MTDSKNIPESAFLSSSSEALSRRNWRRLRRALPTTLWGYLYSLREKVHAVALMRSVIVEIRQSVNDRYVLSGDFGNPLSPNRELLSLEQELVNAWRDGGTVGKEQSGYQRVYAPLLAQIRATPNARILEIGIYRGGSHRAWRDLTHDTEVLGIDIDRATLIQEERIASTVGDQIRLESLDSAVKKLGGVVST